MKTCRRCNTIILLPIYLYPTNSESNLITRSSFFAFYSGRGGHSLITVQGMPRAKNSKVPTDSNNYQLFIVNFTVAFVYP